MEEALKILKAYKTSSIDKLYSENEALKAMKEYAEQALYLAASEAKTTWISYEDQYDVDRNSIINLKSQLKWSHLN